jgi:hypothetical protein
MDRLLRPGRPVSYALSLKQPWAALLVHGRKTVEVRSWRPTRRGRILIHAARVPDERPEAWQRVPAELLDTARQQVGGIIGACELVDYLVYRNQEAFARDQARHLNEPCWFDRPSLYGFVFKNPTLLPFRPCPGQTRFFAVEPEEPAAGGV